MKVAMALPSQVRPPNCTDEVTFVSVKVKDLTALWESLEAKTVNR